MPLLDVSDLMSDPDFIEDDGITVIRRAIVMVKGRPTTPDPVTYAGVNAIVNSGISELMRAEDKQYMPNRISVHTQFKLQGPAPGFMPDFIVWRGDNYVTKTLDDYSKYGAGFVHADCESVDSIDSPPGTP